MSISATLSPAKSATTAFTPTTLAAPQHLPKLSPPKLLKYPKPSFSPYSNCRYTQCSRQPIQLKSPRASSSSSPSSDDNIAPTHRSIHGECFVVDDNIDTDQIIPAEYLTLVPSKPDEYEKLGSYAMCGLPARFGKFIAHGDTKTKYPIVIGGANFGCGSSREHAPVCLGAAGVKAIVAESYARIFFRNSVSTGAVYPLESEGRICLEFKTGHVVTVDLDDNSVVNHTTGRRYMLKPIGDARPVIDAGGIFNYARKAGMIATASP